ncbi:nuclear transport factor 2 family protein [Mycobacterium sp. pUA109]|uniref:nuclear transport factor 2 family protein n=1 Tax=Mycobacterium sp. pUA109 TaxID=3238982 RepID=UPI00351AEAC9
MTLTYQQQHLLDAATGRDAILNLTARHNRYYSDGDRNGWIATFRHTGARFTQDTEVFTDLHAAFDGGGGQRLITVDHDITVDGINATQRCVAILYALDNRGISTLRATGTYRDTLIYERGGWYFTTRELHWDAAPI